MADTLSEVLPPAYVKVGEPSIGFRSMTWNLMLLMAAED
jgi:hypothetical protein